jgi:hypothetical protein
VTVTRVFRVVFEVDRYQQLGYDLAERPPLTLLRFRGTSRRAEWTSQPVAVHGAELRTPDIWCLGGVAVLVLSLETIEKLEPLITMAGELLPVNISGSEDELFILNITTDVACLDTQSSSLGPGTRKLVFLEERLPETGLFKVPQNDAAFIFVVEKEGCEELSLRRRIDDYELEGIRFQEVWSSVDGATSFGLFDDVWSPD